MKQLFINKKKNYGKILKYISKSVEETSETKDKGNRFINYSPNPDFYTESCYMRREDDDKVIQNIINSENMFILEGNEGCGKTTFLTYLFGIKLEEINPKYKYIRLDFNNKKLNIPVDILNSGNKDLIIDNLEDKIIRNIKGFYFYDNKILDNLVATLIFESFHNNQGENIFCDFLDLTSIIHDYIIEKENENFVLTIEWLQNNKKSRKFIRFGREILKLEHYIWGLQNLENFQCEKFFIVLDNTDALPNQSQPFYVTALKYIHHYIPSPFCIGVIALRSENLIHAFDEGINTLRIETYHYDFYNREPIRNIFNDENSSRLRNIKEDEFNFIMKARLNHAIRLEETDLENRGIHDIDCSNYYWFFFKVLTDVLETKFLKIKLSKLTNGSIRRMLNCYYNFFEFLYNYNFIFKLEKILKLTESEENVESERSKENKEYRSLFIESLFYIWIIQKGKAHGIITYNLVDLTEKIEYSKDEPKCVLEYLILTFLLKKQNYFIIYREILDYFGEKGLGFKNDTINRSLVNLWQFNPKNPGGSMIDIRSNLENEYITNADQTGNKFNDSDQIWLNPLGEIVCKETANKYIVIITQLYNNLKDNKINIFSLIKIKPDFLVELSKFLFKMANIHIEGLISIRDKLEVEFPNNWFKFYKSNFSRKVYSKSQKKSIENLQLLIILNYHIPYIIKLLNYERNIIEDQLDTEKARKKRRNLRKRLFQIEECFIRINMLIELENSYRKIVNNSSLKQVSIKFDTLKSVNDEKIEELKEERKKRN